MSHTKIISWHICKYERYKSQRCLLSELCIKILCTHGYCFQDFLYIITFFKHGEIICMKVIASWNNECTKWNGNHWLRVCADNEYHALLAGDGSGTRPLSIEIPFT